MCFTVEECHPELSFLILFSFTISLQPKLSMCSNPQEVCFSLIALHVGLHQHWRFSQLSVWETIFLYKIYIHAMDILYTLHNMLQTSLNMENKWGLMKGWISKKSFVNMQSGWHLEIYIEPIFICKITNDFICVLFSEFLNYSFKLGWLKGLVHSVRWLNTFRNHFHPHLSSIRLGGPEYGCFCDLKKKYKSTGRNLEACPALSQTYSFHLY